MISILPKKIGFLLLIGISCAIVLMLVIYGDPESFGITKQYSAIIDRFYGNSGGSWPFSIIAFDLSSGQAIQLAPVTTIGNNRTAVNSTIDLEINALVLKTADGVNSKLISELPKDIIISLYNEGNQVCVFDYFNNHCNIVYESGNFEYDLTMNESHFKEYEIAILKVKFQVISPEV